MKMTVTSLQINATMLLSGLKPITPDCFSIFAPFYAERAKRYVYPRYMQSLCVMLNMGRCYYSIIKGRNGQILSIFKLTTIYGKYASQMIVLPISISGSIQDEKEVMKAALSVGISLRVTSEDIHRYNIPTNHLKENNGAGLSGQRFGNTFSAGFHEQSDEFIYEANRAVAMQGACYRKQRYQTKRILMHKGFRSSSGVFPNAEGIVRLWDMQYKRKFGMTTHQIKLWEICKSAPSDYVLINNIFINNNLQALSVLERIAPKHYVIVQRVRNYGSEINDVGSAMQYVDCHNALIFSEQTSASRSQVFLNMGLGRSEGIFNYKESLIPCKHQKIYNFITSKTDSAKIKQYFA